MRWPNPSDYQDAIQNPHLCFNDPELKAGTVALLPMGLPRVASGNFASVYEIQTGKKRWAVRCFLRQATDQQRHYTYISQHLHSIWLPFLVDFEYQQQGIRILGQTYPIVKMQWVESIALHSFVKKHLKQPQNLLKLAAQWRGLVNSLQGSHLAHGDLQHGNVLVTSKGEIRLVDYDAMYVPGLYGTNCAELGHPNYQHPQRTGTHYDDYLDNFSALVIYVSLRALAVEPALWQDFHTGENLIFSIADFKVPSQSPVFQTLRRSKQTEVQMFAMELEKWCVGTVTNIGNFENVISKTTSTFITQILPALDSTVQPMQHIANISNNILPPPAHSLPSASTHSNRWWMDPATSAQPAKTQIQPIIPTMQTSPIPLVAPKQSSSAALQPPRSVQIKVNPVDGADMVWIPEGDFLMGNNTGNVDEMPQRTFWISGYFVYQKPVTVVQYREFCSQTGNIMPIAPAWGWKDLHPVVNVSWDDAKRYSRWAKVELPTEAQWEKSARGTDGRMFPWGNAWSAHCCCMSRTIVEDAGGTIAVGSYPMGASPYGVLDIAGNVWEWCNDFYDGRYFSYAPQQNPLGPSTGSHRILRGGSWYNVASNFHISNRFHSNGDRRQPFYGFRCVVR